MENCGFLHNYKMLKQRMQRYCQPHRSEKHREGIVVVAIVVRVVTRRTRQSSLVDAYSWTGLDVHYVIRSGRPLHLRCSQLAENLPMLDNLGSRPRLHLIKLNLLISYHIIGPPQRLLRPSQPSQIHVYTSQSSDILPSILPSTKIENSDTEFQQPTDFRSTAGQPFSPSYIADIEYYKEVV